MATTAQVRKAARKFSDALIDGENESARGIRARRAVTDSSGQVREGINGGCPCLSVLSLAGGIAGAAAIGVLGGLFPAIRAARLPIATALREI